MPETELIWLTNEHEEIANSIRAEWRMQGTDWSQGPPQATDKYSAEDLRTKGYVGLYLKRDKKVTP